MINTVALTFLATLIVPKDLKKIREHFPLMNKHETSVALIKEITRSSKDVNLNVKVAYFAAAEMASAKYKTNPFTKLKTFNDGKKILESIISADTTNLETRYIRYTIQQNAPVFLGYNGDIAADKQFLIQNVRAIKTKDTELFSDICAYLLVHGKLNEHEKGIIKTGLN